MITPCASVIPYPARVVGFPVVIFDQSKAGMSVAESVVPAVTRHCASVVTLVYVPAVHTFESDMEFQTIPIPVPALYAPFPENCEYVNPSVPITVVPVFASTQPVVACHHFFTYTAI